MGQSSSQSNGYYNYQTSFSSKTRKRSSFRSPFIRRKQREPLSATFTANISSTVDALNINTATVEQLMTLPGVNRQIAQQIFEHRKAIGGRFQRIDDLALVSGIGAEKLEKIRPDICIKKTKSNSVHEPSISSRTVSLDSVISEPVFNTSNKIILNVNKATVFELQQLHEINQEIAANIVEYRLKKGLFKKLDDLVKVKGMTRSRLGAVRPYLSLNDEDIILVKTPKLIRHASTLSNVTSNKSNYNQQQINNNNYNHHQHHHHHHHRGHRRNSINYVHRKSLSLPIKMKLNNNGLECNTPVSDIFELLGAYSHRPIVERDYRWERNGFSTIRLSSWNLDRMCFEKSENLGVKEVVCRTILENRLSIVCIQEIVDPEALNQFCCELNTPTLKRVQEWRENSNNWKFFYNKACEDGSLNGLGFIYDSDFCQLVDNETIEIDLSDCDINEPDSISPTAYLAAFRLSDWTCYVLNIYLKYYNIINVNKILKSIEKNLNDYQKYSQTKLPNINDVFLVVGDFTGMKYQIGEFYRKNLNKFNINSQSIENVNGSLTQSTISLNNRHDQNQRIHIEDYKDDMNTVGVDNELKHLGFYSIFKSNLTKLSTYNQNYNDNHLQSSCNILCREKLINEKVILNKTIKVPLPKNGSEKLTGHSGIIRKGLNHMAIPKNWSWGGPASEYCPIWIEIYRRSNREHSVINTTPLRNKVVISTSNTNIQNCANSNNFSNNNNKTNNLNEKNNKTNFLTNGDCCKTTNTISTSNNNINNSHKDSNNNKNCSTVRKTITNSNNSILKLTNSNTIETNLDYDSTRI